MPAQRKPVAISTMARMTVGTADSQACSLSAAGLFGRGIVDMLAGGVAGDDYENQL